MPDQQTATMADISRVEGNLSRVEAKVDCMREDLTVVSSDLRSIKESLQARDILEHRERVLKAELAAREEKLHGEIRSKDEALKTTAESTKETWRKLKDVALAALVVLSLFVNVPGVIAAWQKIRGLIPGAGGS